MILRRWIKGQIVVVRVEPGRRRYLLLLLLVLATAGKLLRATSACKLRRRGRWYSTTRSASHGRLLLVGLLWCVTRRLTVMIVIDAIGLLLAEGRGVCTVLLLVGVAYGLLLIIKLVGLGTACRVAVHSILLLSSSLVCFQLLFFLRWIEIFDDCCVLLSAIALLLVASWRDTAALMLIIIINVRC